MMITAMLVPADFEVAPMLMEVLHNDLGAFQAAVGGWIEAVTLVPATLILNEEGKLDRLPVNHRATVLWYQLLGHDSGDVLVGNVLVFGPSDGHGDFTSCPAEITAMCGL